VSDPQCTYGARFSDRKSRSRMPLNPTPLLRLKRCHAYDQWHSSRVSIFLQGTDAVNCV
jgi:hypothetical protein